MFREVNRNGRDGRYDLFLRYRTTCGTRGDGRRWSDGCTWGSGSRMIILVRRSWCAGDKVKVRGGVSELVEEGSDIAIRR